MSSPSPSSPSPSPSLGARRPRRSQLFNGRYVEHRVTTRDDLKYAYAAWRLGKFDLWGFEPDADTSGQDFIDAAATHMLDHYQHVYTVCADTAEGKRPAGLAFFYQPEMRAPHLLMACMLWFPWATSRNKLETMVHLMNVLRKDYIIIEYGMPGEQKFWEHVCRYGVMRRVGTMHDFYEGPCAVYQTRKRR